MKVGLEHCVFLGNLDAKRDWGHARDYIEIMWMMLKQQEPDDYVIATGHQSSVRDFVNAAARHMGLQLTWQGHGTEEKATDQRGKCVIAVDPHYFRPAEVETLLGDASKARAKLKWNPKTTFDEMVEEMVTADLRTAEKDLLIHNSGYRVHSAFD